MARSIHTTRRALAELRKKKCACDETKAKAVDEAREQLRRKRLGLLANCSEWEANVAADDFHRRWIPFYRAVAFCALDNETEMEKALESYLGVAKVKPGNDETALRQRRSARSAVFRRAGRPPPDDPPGSAGK